MKSSASPTGGIPEQSSHMNPVEENRNLREALRENQELVLAIRFYIRRMAHDFRSPIADIMSYFSGLRRDIGSVETVRTNADSIFTELTQGEQRLSEQCTRLNRVVNETLRAIASEEPKALLAPRRFEDRLGSFLDDLQFAFRRRFEDVKKQLEIDVCDVTRDARISTDKGLVTEILENLLSNALEHGGEKVRLVARRSPGAEPGTLQFTVSDNGAGIADKAMLAFLQPDSEVPAPEHAASSTRGFGLLIAKLLAKAHGGKLSHEKGQPYSPWVTNFVVTLPNAILES